MYAFVCAVIESYLTFTNGLTVSYKKVYACLTLQELLQLEEDVKLLEEVYPQGEKVKGITHVTSSLSIYQTISPFYF